MASMKLYKALAATYKPYVQLNDLTEDEQIMITAMIRDTATVLHADNGAFRFDTFYKACGLDPTGQVRK